MSRRSDLRLSPAMMMRWSWRDLRKRWVLVTTIAFVIAIGTGVYAGLGSTAAWRRLSNDASYSVLNTHDVRVRLDEGASVDMGRLSDLAGEISHSDLIDAVEERLVLPTQVDASGAAGTVLVPGELVGVDVAGGGPVVDAIGVVEGEGFAGREDVALVESGFTIANGLPPRGEIKVGGGRTIRYVGTATSPEYYIVTGRQAGLFAQGGFAVVFVPLDLAHSLVGRPNAVNDLVVRLEEGSDPALVRDELEDIIDERLGGIGVTVSTLADDPVHRVLYEDIENDQMLWNMISFLILLGAAFAAFNLVSRIVESQRREIGIGMALGVRPWILGIRPLLVGLQIAAVGAIAGIGVGMWMGDQMRQMLSEALPLPIWRTPFRPDVYLRATIIGIALPVGATLLPVWRAVRVPPVEAIRTGHLAAKSSGWAGLTSRRQGRGAVLRRLPVRNLLRTPRRTALTALGVGAAIAALVGTMGMLDTFLRTLDVAAAEFARSAPERITVALDRPYPIASPAVRGIETSPEVSWAESGLTFGGEARSGDGDPIDVFVDIRDLRDGMWTPRLLSGGLPSTSNGIVLSTKAAEDLGVGTGDTITLTHPERTGTYRFESVDDELVVAGVHASPFRPSAYMEEAAAELFGAQGWVNYLNVIPAAGMGPDDVKAALFEHKGVASAEPILAFVESYEELIDRFTGILGVAAFAVLVLAGLIAFNSTRITVEERVRDHATMFAFGLPVRTVLWHTTIESALTGVLGTAVGVGLGWLFVVWVIETMLPQTMPDLAMTPFIAAVTLGSAVFFGVAAVAITPLLTVRRLTRLDVPTALRVVE